MIQPLSIDIIKSIKFDKNWVEMSSYQIDSLTYWILLYQVLHSDENLSLWWKSITEMKICHSDESFSLWWNIITQLKSYHFDENWWLWLKFIMLLESHHFNKLFSTANIFHHLDEYLCLQWTFDLLKKSYTWRILLVLKFVNQIKLTQAVKIHMFQKHMKINHYDLIIITLTKTH